MHVKPVRYQDQRCLHFITSSCYHRLPLLDTCAAKQTFERELERVRAWYGCYITGYVVMPEHVHLLISEPERSKLSVVIQMLKQITSQKLHAQHLPRFWQVRYYDFPVWSEAKRIEKLRYIHRNPVRRGLVKAPEDWKWSSFVHYATGIQGLSRSNRNGRRVGENNRVSCSWREPTLPPRTREGWGNFDLKLDPRRQFGQAENEVAPPLSRLLRQGGPSTDVALRTSQ
jgi:putative transposase